MAEAILYHNPHCSKSRGALDLLRANGVEPNVVFYLETPPNHEELTAILHKLAIPARQLIRAGEKEYETLNLHNDALSDQELINAMAIHPKLIERPIFVVGDRAVIGRPPTKVLELL